MLRKISALTLVLLVFSACHRPQVPLDLVVTANLDRTDSKVNYDVPVDICIVVDFTDEGRARQHRQCVLAVPLNVEKFKYRAAFSSTLVFERSGLSDAALDNADFQNVTVSIVSHLGQIPLKTKARPVFSLAKVPFSGSIKTECNLDVVVTDLVADLEKDLARQVERSNQVKDSIVGRNIEEHAKNLDVESLAQLCSAFSARDGKVNGRKIRIANPVKLHAMQVYVRVNRETLSAGDLIRLQQIAAFPEIINAIHQEVQPRF